jgi:hypothetical protein
MIGDTGQKDLELYGRITQKYPNNVLFCFIRNVAGTFSLCPTNRPTGSLPPVELTGSLDSRHRGTSEPQDDPRKFFIRRKSFELRTALKERYNSFKSEKSLEMEKAELFDRIVKAFGEFQNRCFVFCDPVELLDCDAQNVIKHHILQPHYSPTSYSYYIYIHYNLHAYFVST